MTAADVVRHVEDTYEEATGETGSGAWDELGLNLSGDPPAAFIVAWERVRVPEGQGLWETVTANARTYPFIPKIAPSVKYVHFVSLAAHLQRARAPGQRIMLPVRRFASILGVTPQMISVYRRWAVAAGILIEVMAADPARKRATEYLVALDQFDADRLQRTKSPGKGTN
jgi:hypothetical protein